MIAYLKGILASVDEKSIIVDVNGVGYLVNISTSTLGELPKIDSEIKIFTHVQSSESGQFLYGFLSQEEVKLFTMLISVSGIGPKVALAVLSNLTPSQIMIAIISGDAAALSKAPGVGRKTAERILLDLRGKIKTDDNISITTRQTGLSGSVEKQDALDALIALGYGKSEAVQTVMEVTQTGMTTDIIIRKALNRLRSV